MYGRFIFTRRQNNRARTRRDTYKLEAKKKIVREKRIYGFISSGTSATLPRDFPKIRHT